MIWVAVVLIMLAFVMLMVSAVGLLRLQGALARQHAVTKAATLSLSLGIAGLMVYVYQAGWLLDHGYGSGWFIKLLLLWLVLLITLPLASHALARSSLSEEHLNQLILDPPENSNKED